jgi:hypothetical protein
VQASSRALVAEKPIQVNRPLRQIGTFGTTRPIPCPARQNSLAQKKTS